MSSTRSTVPIAVAGSATAAASRSTGQPVVVGTVVLDVSPLLDGSVVGGGVVGGAAWVSVSVIVIDLMVTVSNGGTPLFSGLPAPSIFGSVVSSPFVT